MPRLTVSIDLDLDDLLEDGASDEDIEALIEQVEDDDYEDDEGDVPASCVCR